ncbi:McrB family protein [Serinicoccus sediminis]|uniref:McrB family protein n=1 Tax=Serinicoccus sediminis TaxID=2306021 RepID=UPI0013EA3833|nr:AAA family ATPase [Serinicoccus sediminis]
MTTTNEAVAALQVFKNVILEGPPGTGKSFSIASIAEAWPGLIGTNDDGEPAAGNGSWLVTFHPSTSYEEFVEGIRYNPKPSDPKDPHSKALGFELRPGVFRNWIEAARAQPDRDFLVLIDEVNRANVSKVLGDLLLGLEASKRLRHDPTCTRTDKIHGTCWTDGVTTQLPYSNELLGVPSNLYVLGTMNTSDRSITPLDAALRRRFAFVRVEPLSGTELTAALTAALPGAGPAVDRSAAALDSLNDALRHALGPDAMLGHSYLFDIAAKPGRFQFWMEVNEGCVTWGQLQTTKPFANALLAAVGVETPLSKRGTAAELTIHYEGTTYRNVKLENPTSGNVRFGGNHTGIPFKDMTDGVTVWTPTGISEVELGYIPHDAAKSQLADYRARSVIDYSSSARGLGRVWSTEGSSYDDTERAVWRYAILPQLIETVSQAFSLDLMSPAVRQDWLDANLTPAAAKDVDTALASFEAFLNNHLGLKISPTGHGLAASLAIEAFEPDQEVEAPIDPADDPGTGAVADTQSEAEPATAEPSE